MHVLSIAHGKSHKSVLGVVVYTWSFMRLRQGDRLSPEVQDLPGQCSMTIKNIIKHPIKHSRYSLTLLSTSSPYLELITQFTFIAFFFLYHFYDIDFYMRAA